MRVITGQSVLPLGSALEDSKTVLYILKRSDLNSTPSDQVAPPGGNNYLPVGCRRTICVNSELIWVIVVVKDQEPSSISGIG
jgi:hypothetical protein